ncbi:MAG TPA: DUF2277 domain-containing protein [Candidatus Saccharimonadales bacterium]|nr:DUF2277 domain-containing protein [Candidatus Saccharimonadales bacterium]
MCRNIKPLFNFEPVATDAEITDASIQFVRKISGYTHPSQANQEPFDQAVAEICAATKHLLSHLETNAEPKNREEEKRKAHEKAVKRFGLAN